MKHLSVVISMFATLMLFNLPANFDANLQTQEGAIYTAGAGCSGPDNDNPWGKKGGHDVPEPLTMALVAGGLLGFGLYRKYKKNDDNTDKEND